MWFFYDNNPKTSKIAIGILIGAWAVPMAFVIGCVSVPFAVIHCVLMFGLYKLITHFV